MLNLSWPAWNVLDVCTNYVDAVRLDARATFWAWRNVGDFRFFTHPLQKPKLAGFCFTIWIIW